MKIIIPIFCAAFLFLSFGKFKSYKRANKQWEKGEKIFNLHYQYNCIHIDQVKEAERYYKKALKIYPNHVSAINSMGLTQYYQENYTNAIELYTKAVHLDSDFSLAYNNRGMAYNELQEYKLAEKDYNTAILKDYRNVRAHYNLGCNYHDMNNYEQAITAYDQAILIDSNYIYAYNNRGFSKLMDSKYHEAILDFTTAVEKDPNYKSAWTSRGLAKYYLKDYLGAISDFQRALSTPTSWSHKYLDTYAYNNMANCYAELGQHTQSCFFWKKALEIGYKYNPEWQRTFGIEDPNKLIEKFCN
jgi:tetratricopeptide (TPR) repeat protein